MTSIRNLLAVAAAGLLAAAAPLSSIAADNPARPNILIITVDDMSCDSVGAFGCELPDTTPHIDRLAADSLRFQYAHVCVGNCMPSRNVMFSGRYPHNNRVEGFYQVRDKDYPVLCDLMKAGGYFVAIRGKVSHSTPYLPYAWDLVLDTAGEQKAHPKDVQSYYESTKRGIAASQEAGKPFCLNVNVSDPHKPFYATGKGGQQVDDPYVPSRIFTADEVPVPGFLPDDPVVKKELAQYYSTVRRADDCVGRVLAALDDSGEQDNTVVVILSDHGMPLPFAKTALWHHSTHTPLIVRWPGVTSENTIDDRHMVSAVDLLPTLLDIAGIEHPKQLDGASFVGAIRGELLAGRGMVFKEYNENSGGGRHPMRSVQTKRFGYIFNPWVDGERVFRTATTGTMTYRRMKQLAATDEAVAARLELFDHRVVEELYDYENDPDALHNLAGDPNHADTLAELRRVMEEWMVRTGDHALEAFRNRDNPEALAAYMTRVEQESAERRSARRKNRDNRNSSAKRKNARLISIETPQSLVAGKPAAISVKHTIPKRLGEQLIHVTLKHGESMQRIERKVLKASGAGTAKVEFVVPADTADIGVRIAAFIGSDYDSNLQHLQSGVVPVRASAE